MDMTVREYLEFVAELKSVPKDRRKYQVASAMEKTGTNEVSKRLIKHLSKGYRQRVGIAQAIIGNPEVIILDEPTVGLDPLQIIEIRDLMKDLAKDHTVILSSHILSEISAVCDTVMIINKGKLVVSDTVENLPKYLNAQNNCRVVVKGTEEMVHPLFAEMAEIKELTLEGDGEFVTVTVTTDSQVDLREDIFFACAKAGLPIYEMTNVAKNLEDIFLELTQSEDDDEQSTDSTEEEVIVENTEESEETTDVSDL